MSLNCGQCIGCRIERSRQWAVRCVHESQMHDESCFITLTYDDDFLPYGASLHKPDYQNFLKRLRKKHSVRFFLGAEYGDTTQRPHYHAILFGWRPDDPELFSESADGIRLYTSPTLTRLWGMGHATFGDATFDSAAYCAGYTRKKITGDQASTHYAVYDPDTGEIFERLPEFGQMSLRPGIGKTWLDRYGVDAYQKDQVILRGKAMKPPRFYDTHIEVQDPQLWQTTRLKRSVDAFKKYSPLTKPNPDYDPNSSPGSQKRLITSTDFPERARRQYCGQVIAKKRATMKDAI